MIVEPELTTITPAMAAQWLLTSPGNRKITQERVDRYANAMATGGWYYNGQAIILDDANQLIGGHHRLRACVQANVPFDSLVQRGVDPKAFLSLGDTRGWTAADYLSYYGYSNCNMLGAALRSILYYERFGTFTNVQTKNPATILELLNLAAERPEIEESVRFAKHGYQHARILRPGSIIAALHHEFTRIDEDDAAAFFHSAATGNGLSKGHPIFALRSRLIDNATSHSKMSAYYVAALFIKAWNYYREGREITLLMWKPGGSSPESFPTIK